MNPFLRGFTHELIKTGSVLKSVGRFAVKHPILSLSAGMTGLGTAVAAKNAYGEGIGGGEKPRYLNAAVDSATGETQASPAAYANYHQLFPHKPTEREKWLQSRYYRENEYKS